jgi:uncharacterized GH25 family protein
MRLLAGLILCAGLQAAPAVTTLTVHVVSDTGKPVDRASVIVRFVKGRDKIKFYKKMMTSYELRTDQDGRATIPSIPQGSIRVQVIAANYQTYGQVIDVDEPRKTVEVQLNPPQAQYSAH